MLNQRDCSLKVTEENTSDSEVLRPLLKDVNFEDALADGAYDTNDAFEFMKSNSADCTGIKIRGNAVAAKENPPCQWRFLNTKNRIQRLRQMHP